MSERKTVKIQKLKVINSSTTYEQWLENKGLVGGNRIDQPAHENRQANPDSLGDDDAMYANSQMTMPQELMGQAVAHLQGRQKQVYLLTMREGLSLQESALKLGITKATAQVYKTRAIAFISDYCRQAIERGII